MANNISAKKANVQHCHLRELFIKCESHLKANFLVFDSNGLHIYMNAAYNMPFNKIVSYGSLKQFFSFFQIVLIVQGLKFFVIVLLTIQKYE